MTIKWDDKDPDDIDAFSLDWSTRLASETIASSLWVIDPADGATPLTNESQSNTTAITTIWLSGGVEDESYALTNRITTTAGRTLDQTVRLKVKTR
jgi:hypothetical protein